MARMKMDCYLKNCSIYFIEFVENWLTVYSSFKNSLDIFFFVSISFHILHSSQYGFRNRHSAQHATLEILNDILTNFNKGQFTFCLFIDLKKAFETVNCGILFSKLENYGFNGVVNDWFKLYLIGCRDSTRLSMVIYLMPIKPSVEYLKAPCFFSCI